VGPGGAAAQGLEHRRQFGEGKAARDGPEQVCYFTVA
jgi:hypothetical protein